MKLREASKKVSNVLLGKLVRRKREAFGWTQEQLAENLSENAGYKTSISELESNPRNRYA